MARRLLVLGGLAPLCLVVLPVAQAAGTPPESGWWSTTEQSSPVAPPASVPAPAPDVPQDGLLVQGGVAAPTAYAAVSFAVPAGLTPGILTLTQVQGTASAPGSALKACPLVPAAFTPAQGGASADAPAYDCGRSVEATAGDGSWAFDVATLAQGEVLAVAVVPSAPDVRVVLSAPTAASLTTSGSAIPAPTVPGTAPADQDPTGGADSGADSGPAPASDDVPAPAGGGVDAGTFPSLEVAPEAALSSGEQPAAVPAAAAPEAAPEQAVTLAAAPQGLPVALSGPSSGEGRGGGRVLGILLAGAAALATSLWAFAGGSRATVA